MMHVRDVSLVPVTTQVTPDRDNVTLAISKDNYSKPGQAISRWGMQTRSPDHILRVRRGAIAGTLRGGDECAVVRQHYQTIIDSPAHLTHHVTGNLPVVRAPAPAN